LGGIYIETYVRKQPNTGRNDPCPCGSGKKYKKCCLPDDGRTELLSVTEPVTRLKGMEPRPEHPVSIEDIETAIRRRAHEQE
jgi:hypothetical protein